MVRDRPAAQSSGQGAACGPGQQCGSHNSKRQGHSCMPCCCGGGAVGSRAVHSTGGEGGGEGHRTSGRRSTCDTRPYCRSGGREGGGMREAGAKSVVIDEGTRLLHSSTCAGAAAGPPLPLPPHPPTRTPRRLPARTAVRSGEILLVHVLPSRREFALHSQLQQMGGGGPGQQPWVGGRVGESGAKISPRAAAYRPPPDHHYLLPNHHPPPPSCALPCLLPCLPALPALPCLPAHQHRRLPGDPAHPWTLHPPPLHPTLRALHAHPPPALTSIAVFQASRRVRESNSDTAVVKASSSPVSSASASACSAHPASHRAVGAYKAHPPTHPSWGPKGTPSHHGTKNGGGP